ncbi:MAG: MotA/TolQ/ExbB proton channel family protein, partial [Pseudomonadota bacterium]
RVMFARCHESSELAYKLVMLAVFVRKRNLLNVYESVQQSTDITIMRVGLELITDGMEPDRLVRILGQQSSSETEKMSRAAGMFRQAGDFAPALGLIGTILGLLNMLANLEDPTAIGPGMAIALLTTLYGSCMAYLVCLPMAQKLERLAQNYHLQDQLCLVAMDSIVRADNPRKLEARLNALLPESEHIYCFS